jgi:hypothetical protein
MRKRLLWFMAGMLAAEAITVILRHAAGWPHFPDLSVVAGALVVAYGEKTGRLQKGESLSRPITIFDGKVPRGG